jgi:uncharacterized protein YjbI with pentapeptide repeats
MRSEHLAITKLTRVRCSLYSSLGCGSRMSPRCFGVVMTGDPARSTATLSSATGARAAAAGARVILRRRVDGQRMSPESKRLADALLLSLLIHASLLTLTFGGQGLWLPGFRFPWLERTIEGPDLSIVVVPAEVTGAEPPVAPIAEPPQRPRVAQSVASGPKLTPSVSRAPIPLRSAAAIVPEANPRTDAATGAAPAQAPSGAEQPGDTASPRPPAPAVIALTRTDEATWSVPSTPAMPAPAIAPTPSASSAEAAMPSLRDAGAAARAQPEQKASERALELAKLDASRQAEQLEAANVEAAKKVEAAKVEAANVEAATVESAKVEASTVEAAKVEAAKVEAPKVEAATVESAKVEASTVEAAKVEAAKVEAAKVEAAKIEAAKVEAAKVEAAKVEAAKIDAAKVEAAKVEAAKIEAAKIEAAKVEAAKVEAANVEAAKVEAARVEAAEVEAAKIEAAKVEAAKVEAAKVEAAKVEAANVEAAKIEAAKIEATRVEAAKVEAAKVEAAKVEAAREERLRAIGRQLDEEAARREGATAPARLLPSSSSARRYWLFGRTDPNAELIRYVEAWSRKIELNMTFDMVRDAVKQPHADPLVTVGIRSDGSVESVTFVQSSGVAAIDEAIRRVVDSQRPYQPFPPGLAREVDVIMIRRTWYFDTAIRLY